MSSVEAQIEEFQKMLVKLREQFDQVESSTKSIDMTAKRDLSIKFKGIQRELTELSRQVRKSSTAMDEIVKKWNKESGEYL
jgi:predicted  nucleic acid-binding Zn-ribbon protein